LRPWNKRIFTVFSGPPTISAASATDVAGEIDDPDDPPLGAVQALLATHCHFRIVGRIFDSRLERAVTRNEALTGTCREVPSLHGSRQWTIRTSPKVDCVALIGRLGGLVELSRRVVRWKRKIFRNIALRDLDCDLPHRTSLQHVCRPSSLRVS
jgi:hypothetical protein